MGVTGCAPFTAALRGQAQVDRISKMGRAGARGRLCWQTPGSGARLKAWSW